MTGIDDGLHDELSGYLDGQLDAEQRAEVEARLTDDPALADELASVAAVRSVPTRDEPNKH